MADRAGLEIQCGVTPTEGSNPSLSVRPRSRHRNPMAAFLLQHDHSQNLLYCAESVLNRKLAVLGPIRHFP